MGRRGGVLPNTFYKPHSITVRDSAIQMIRICHKKYSLTEIARMLRMSVTMVCRYNSGYVRPTHKNAIRICNVLSKYVNPVEVLSELIELDSEGFFDNTKIVYSPSILELVAIDCVKKFIGRRVTKVLTMAVDGVPFATIVASRLNRDLAVLKSYKETGVERFISVVRRDSDGRSYEYFMPSGMISGNDSVLIVDDVVRTGRNLSIMLEAVGKCNADVAGIYVIIAVGDAWKSVIPSGVRFESCITVFPTAKGTSRT